MLGEDTFAEYVMSDEEDGDAAGGDPGRGCSNGSVLETVDNDGADGTSSEDQGAEPSIRPQRARTPPSGRGRAMSGTKKHSRGVIKVAGRGTASGVRLAASSHASKARPVGKSRRKA